MLRTLRKLKGMEAGGLSVLGLAALEFLAIVVAVVVGFMVNEWREGRERAGGAESALAALAREMADNHAELEATYGYHSQIVAAIDERTARVAVPPAGDRAVSYGHELPDWRGVRLPMLRSSTFQMLVSTGVIGDLPFTEADDLARIYSLQSVLEKLGDAAVVRFANDPGFARLPTVRHLFDLYRELTPSLLALYQELGMPILRPHGYDLPIADEGLRATTETHARDYRAQADRQTARRAR